MKNIISLVVLMSSLLIAQTSETIGILSKESFGKSLTELKQLSAVSGQQFAVDSQQLAIRSSQQLISNQISVPEKKNPALAILYSMLLPGMGELYANRYESGKYFTIADGVLWGVFAGFNIYGSQQGNNYKSFAQSKGGVKLEGKDAEFFANLGIYQSLGDYNNAMELDRRFEKVYNTSTHYWQWADNNQRSEYRNMWTSSESAYTNVRFVVGALILNRVISAINAVRLVSAYNKNLTQEMSWNVSFGVETNPTLPSSLKFNFQKAF